jgi:hypothetical protein
MTTPRSDFEGALVRTLNEVEMARINGLIMRQLERCGIPFGLEFFRFVWMALSNDRMARAARVLDKHPRAHGYWYIIEKKRAAAEAAVARHNIDTGGLIDLSARLKTVRDQTIAHIDHQSVIDPQTVWRKAGIKPEHLEVSLMSVRRVVGDIYRDYHGRDFEVPEYDAEDTRAILEAAKRAGIIEG